ncbi:MAG: SDR family NAD(P)-dependent oxidoreductase [Myxococcales bacterium]|nr:SDR family NAD(P)-dependent oxidoreductase [Myxococcales bacterium]
MGAGLGKLDGKHALVTGASSGIGAAVARELAAHGCRVSLVARRRELLDALAAELPGEALVLPRDLASPDEGIADELARAAAEALGPIDVLVNNAGMQRVSDVADDNDSETRAAVERLLAVNLLFPLRLTRAVAPAMVARGSGCIVDVASIAALAAPPGMAAYAASKAGLAAHSETMRAELAQHGVHVVTVYPGPVDTPMAEVGWAAYESTATQRKLLPEGRPDELARLMRRAVERGDDRIIYPRVYGGLRYLSHLARFLIDKLPPSVMGR